MKEAPLKGIKIIDASSILMVPYCTRLLADMGAEVIKIEPPKGDNVRNQGTFVDGFSSYFSQFNRNKKSVILDLYRKEDKEKLKKLLIEADVLECQNLDYAFNLGEKQTVQLPTQIHDFRKSIYEPPHVKFFEENKSRSRKSETKILKIRRVSFKSLNQEFS